MSLYDRAPSSATGEHSQLQHGKTLCPTGRLADFWQFDGRAGENFEVLLTLGQLQAGSDKGWYRLHP